jgi:hypothetical protein
MASNADIAEKDHLWMGTKYLLDNQAVTRALETSVDIVFGKLKKNVRNESLF